MEVKELSKKIAKYEMQIANLNHALNLFYAINRLTIYDPNTVEIRSIQLHEPLIGKVTFKGQEEYDQLKEN